MAKEMAAESSCRILELLWGPLGTRGNHAGSPHPGASSPTAPRVLSPAVHARAAHPEPRTTLATLPPCPSSCGRALAQLANPATTQL